MKRAIRSCRTERVLCAFAIATILAATSASAQPVIAPTARRHFSVTPVPFEQARSATENARSATENANKTAATGAGATTGAAPPEIVELARALKNDPDLIYQYVHDNIEFSPLWGLLKGPVGTLLDGRGDSFDQAALMVALLNQASIANPSISNVAFEFGQLRLTNAQLQSWLGVDSNPYSVAGVLTQGAIPGTPYSNGDADVGHVWVKVSIDGAPFVFDPAFKSHSWKTGVVNSLPSIMGYSQAQFVADAHATTTPTSIQGVNRNSLRNDLTAYAGNLASYIRSNLPRAGVSDVVGGGTVVPTPISNGQTVRQPTNPNQLGTPTDWTSIPSSYYATLSITLPGAAAQTYNSTDIYGHRLSIFFNSSYMPTLYLDGSAVVSGSASSQGSEVGIALSIHIPWAIDSGVFWADQSLTQYISAQTNQNGGSGGYVVQTGWDQVGRGMIEKHRKLLTQAINSGAAINSELVLGESLAMLGYTWLAECAAQQRLSDQLLGTATQYFYGGGIVGQAVGTSISSPYVDLPLNFINTPARVNGAATDTPNSLAAFLDASGASSSFESTSLEQTQANVPGFVAASTVKLLDTGIQNGDTIFDINNGNTSASQQAYTNTIRPQLVPNYNAGALATIDSYVAGGFRVIAPLHGKLPIGNWTGVGFKTLLATAGGDSYGEIISGGLSGGFGGVNDPPGTSASSTEQTMLPGSDSPDSDAPGSIVSGEVGDPIDHRKGSLQYRNNDLVIGAKSFPYGLSFERSYDSGAQASAGPLGYGWTHNFAITATVGSDGLTGMGEGSPLNAVNSIVALYVSSDLMKGQTLTGQSNLANFVLETVVNRWFTDQLTQNVVYVSRGWNTEEFTKMADGSYAPPVGSATILDALGGTFRYRTKSGVTMNFNSSGQISSWTNAAGASVSFSYSGGLLSAVANSATSRHLSLAYIGNQISSVSDGMRTVSYAYSNGALISITDALGQQTTFAYDTSGTQDTAGHLTQVFYPSNPSKPFVTTFYDGLGKVAQQADANGNLTQAFFAGARTEIDDPLGNRHAWYSDPRGNVTSEIQDYGSSPHLNMTTVNTYDGQSNLLTTTKPERNSVSFSYDALFNPLNITQTPKPGSPLSPLVQSFTYAVPVASLPNFEEVQTSTDTNNSVTTYTYNSTAGTLAKVSQPGVTKPGVGLSTPVQVFTYTGVGLLQSFQDAEGRVTRYDYDPTFADQVNKKTVDFGRLNLVTRYGYDGFGDISSTTDANGNTTTSVFDKLRRLTEVDRAVAGVVTKYTYYPDGQVNTRARQVTAGTFEMSHYTYTLSDQLSVVIDPLGNTVTTTYDADDRKQTVTAQVSATQTRQRTFSYDALSRLYQISDTTTGGSGTVLETHTYTPNGKQLAFTDSNNHATGYVYDGFDRLSQTTYPDSGTETYQYDANGNLLQKTLRSGQTIGVTYDALNRVSTKTPQGEAAGQSTYGYDLSGLLLLASDGSSGASYQIAYDTAGRPSSFTDQLGRNTQAQYDSVGNRTLLQWPANTNGTSAYYVTYKYDALDRMTEIDANGSSATPLAKYQWDALSRLTIITYGDGTFDSYSQYDAGDNLLSLTESFTGGTSATFSYAWLKNHQRQSTTVNDSAFQYVPFPGTTSYTTADVDNGYTNANGVAFTYDGNHNLTFDGFNNLTYDVENRLIQAQSASVGISQYLYDPLGHRKEKLVNGVTTQFVLAGNDEIADYAGDAGGGPGAPLLLTVRGVRASPVAAIVESSGGVVYYHQDVLGSTVATTQAGTSGPAGVYSYSEFGMAWGGNFATYRFAGYRYDVETGLYYVRARYYSPELGRFLQTDPIGHVGGRNLYAYVENNPVNLRDPFGTCGNPQGCLAAIPFVVGQLNPGAYGSWFEDQFVANYGLEAQTLKFFTDVGNTIPDFYGEGIALGEIKTSAELFLGEYGQIPAQLAAATEEGIPYILVVSPTTEVSAPLIGAAIETGGGVFVYNAAAGSLAVAEGAEAGLSVVELLEILGALALL
jgi:RHS repeat-associated protein